MPQLATSQQSKTIEQNETKTFPGDSQLSVVGEGHNDVDRCGRHGSRNNEEKQPQMEELDPEFTQSGVINKPSIWLIKL